jgi:hypothetical protein
VKKISSKSLIFLLYILKIKTHKIATGYGLDDRGIGVRVPVWERFFLLHVVQTGSEAHPASYPMGTGGLSPRVKRPRREVDHSPPTSAEVKITWIHISIPPYAFMAW